MGTLQEKLTHPLNLTKLGQVGTFLGAHDFQSEPEEEIVGNGALGEEVGGVDFRTNLLDVDEA